LKYQIGTQRKTRGGRRYLPYVFIEPGVPMLSRMLNTPGKLATMPIRVIDIDVAYRAYDFLDLLLKSSMEL
jgi:hypothetical protein